MSGFDDPLSSFISEPSPTVGNSNSSMSSSSNSVTSRSSNSSISPSSSATTLAVPVTGGPSTNTPGMPQPILVVEASRSNSQTAFYNPNANTNNNNNVSNPNPPIPGGGFNVYNNSNSNSSNNNQPNSQSQQQYQPPQQQQQQPSSPRPDLLPPPRPSPEYIINTMTASFLSKCNTKPLDISSLKETEQCVMQLSSSKAWKPALQLLNNMCNVEEALRQSPPGTFPPLLKIKLECYYWLQLFDELSNEASTILAREEATNQDGSNSPGSLCNKQLSSVSISLLILLEEVKALTGGFKEAMEQLFRYKKEFESTPSAIKNHVFWIWRIRQAIINIAVSKRTNWRIALTMSGEMLDDLLKWGEKFKGNEKMIRSITIMKLVSLCRLSRLYLQASNLQYALKSFKYAKAEYAKLKGVPVDTIDLMTTELAEHWDRYYAMSFAILEFTENKFDAAYALLGRLIVYEVAFQKSNVPNIACLDLVQAQSASSSSELEIDLMNIEVLVCSEGSLLNVAVNNYAICALYLKKMGEAVMKLEQLIYDDPAANLNDPIVFNLCTLYDLSCTQELSQNKKKVLHNVSLAYHIHDPVLKEKNFRFQSV